MALRHYAALLKSRAPGHSHPVCRFDWQAGMPARPTGSPRDESVRLAELEARATCFVRGIFSTDPHYAKSLAFGCPLVEALTSTEVGPARVHSTRRKLILPQTSKFKSHELARDGSGSRRQCRVK